MSEMLSVLCPITAAKKPRGFLKHWAPCFCCQSSTAPGTGWAQGQAGWWPPGIPDWSRIGGVDRLGWLHPWNRPLRVPSTPLLRSPVRMWFAPCANWPFGRWIGTDKPRTVSLEGEMRECSKNNNIEQCITFSSWKLLSVLIPTCN